MKGWLSRAVANTALRGEERWNRIARWSRWLPAKPAVDDDKFRGADDPYHRHWREFPDPWRPVDPSDPAVRKRLRDAMEELPQTWKGVVERRDVQDREPAEVSAELGITPEQQRAILNRARAFLRERLAQLLARDTPRERR
ncbi:RNA polymerase sigma factor [Kribbella catacumbae]|uniref:RNA polymerase sigma factor n=1 Tax=Kribbella catacumbae TaxID=460086 RepID=UPI00038035EA|nr:sigma-70 family RNA polymerase sigma factor [Kribbella catacumbae]